MLKVKNSKKANKNSTEIELMLRDAYTQKAMKTLNLALYDFEVEEAYAEFIRSFALAVSAATCEGRPENLYIPIDNSGIGRNLIPGSMR